MHIDTKRFFEGGLVDSDPIIYGAIQEEILRQNSQLELLAPKNYMSAAAGEALGSIFAFTSIEGYPGRRFHSGMVNIDRVESAAINRAKQMFGCKYANVQAHSGTQANQAVFFAFLKPGDAVLSLALSAGGHLSHGLRTNMSGRWFTVHHYNVRPADGLIDYDEARQIAKCIRPKLIIVGGSSYPRAIDFAQFRAIADSSSAILLADTSHFSGLITAKLYPNPFPHCDVVTTTTNKNLRGPHGAIVLSNDSGIARAIDEALFPGVQGGPIPELIVAKAVCFEEVLTDSFVNYATAVLENSRALAARLLERNFDVVTNGTDTPIVMLDLRSNGLTGDFVARQLEFVGIICNKNLVPGDTLPPSITSGIRFGTSAVTTRGLRGSDMSELSNVVCDVIEACSSSTPLVCKDLLRRARERVAILSQRHPLYP